MQPKSQRGSKLKSHILDSRTKPLSTVSGLLAPSSSFLLKEHVGGYIRSRSAADNFGVAWTGAWSEPILFTFGNL